MQSGIPFSCAPPVVDHDHTLLVPRIHSPRTLNARQPAVFDASNALERIHLAKIAVLRPALTAARIGLRHGNLFRSSRIIFYRDALAREVGPTKSLCRACWPIHADNLIDTGRMQSAGICSRLIGTHSLIQPVIASDFCAMAV